MTLSVAAHGAALLVAIGHPGHATLPTSLPAVAHVHADPLAGGDTFEIPTDAVDDERPRGHAAAPSAEAPPPPATTAPAGTLVHAIHAPTERLPRVGRTPASAVEPAAEDTGGGAGLRFGATGDRSAVELTSAFTRGFPQAASADPQWATAPLGSAGTVDVDLTLDESGALIGTHASGNATPALAEGLRRTLALIRARAFLADHQATRLRVTATVTPDQVHDGLHGEVFAIGGSFEGGEGNAFFALAVGRRIDIRVRVLP